jgi:hypothetical protein
LSVRKAAWKEEDVIHVAEAIVSNSHENVFPPALAVTLGLILSPFLGLILSPLKGVIFCMTQNFHPGHKVVPPDMQKTFWDFHCSCRPV